MVPLGDVIAPARVARAGNAEAPMLSMTMHGGLVSQVDRFKKRIAALDTSAYKLVRRGQLVVGFPMDEGVLDFQMLHEVGMVSPAYAVWDLLDENRFDRGYLKRFLRSDRAVEYYTAKLRGSTARRRVVPTPDFVAMPVPAPPLSEQRRIVTVLDLADALRAKQRDHLMHLDELIVAITAATVSLATRTRKLALVARTSSGGTPSRKAGGMYGGEIPWVKSGELHGGVVVAAEEHITELAVATSSAKIVQRGAILVAMYGATAGTVARLDIDAATNQAICAIVPTTGVVPAYLQQWLSSQTGALLEMRTGGAQPNLSQAILRGLDVPLPPDEAQEAFARQVAAIEAQRRRVRTAIADFDTLFASLQHRAFRGEL